MKFIPKLFLRGSEAILAAMLAAMFFTFILQVFSRYVLLTPFGWTLELCLILWVWIVFLGNALIVRERDHVTFDIVYLAAPRRIRRVLALISAVAIIAAMAWSFLPTWDYIDWMKIRKTATVRNPFTGSKIPLRTILSVYGIFMIAIMLRYSWRVVDLLRHGPRDDEHALAEFDPHSDEQAESASQSSPNNEGQS